MESNAQLESIEEIEEEFQNNNIIRVTQETTKNSLINPSKQFLNVEIY